MPYPAILFLYELIFKNLKNNWKKLIPFFSLSAVWALILVSRIGQRTESLRVEHYQEGGIDNPLIQVPIAIVNYLKLIFWPRNLTLYHTDLMVNWTGYSIILAIFLIFIGFIIYSYKKNKQVFFWLSFFIISLLPVLTPLRISWVVAERYVYLGSIGIFVIVAMGIAKLSENEKWKPYVYSVFAIIVIALSVRTILRNNDWQNEDTLWIATAKVSDAGPVIHNNLGDMYARHGDLEKAIEEFKRSTEINPRYADGYHNLALTYIQMQKYDLAIENFQKALSINPNIWQSHQQLAAIYFYQEKFDKALEEINIALTINPNNPELKQNFEIISQKAGGN
jgi:tetratricopeptide (TPR) repeat protein